MTDQIQVKYYVTRCIALKTNSTRIADNNVNGFIEVRLKFLLQSSQVHVTTCVSRWSQ